MKREKTIIDLVRFCVNMDLEVSIDHKKASITISESKYIHLDRGTNKVMFGGEGFTSSDDVEVVIKKLRKLLPALKKLEQVKNQLQTIK